MANDLSKEIKKYTDYFGSLARESYDTATGNPKTSLLPAVQWQRPMEAIEYAFDHPWQSNDPNHNPVGWGNFDREAFRPYIENWLQQNRIAALSHVAHGYNGWTANVFLAQIEGVSEPQIVSIGTEAGEMPHLRTAWNPIHRQPDTQNVFVHRQNGESYKLALSRGPFVPMVPENEKPSSVADFFDRHILIGTPYKVGEGRDLSVLRDGTPIYGGATDSLQFISDEAARRHARDQWKPEYQQEIMRTIHNNTERLQADLRSIKGDQYILPDSLRWVVEISPGVFAPKQATLVPDPLQLATPARSIARVKRGHKARYGRSPTRLPLKPRGKSNPNFTP
jgi:hypothetical protein